MNAIEKMQVVLREDYGIYVPKEEITAESAKAEAFLDSDHFYNAKEAAELSKTEGDAKGDFRNVTDALAYFK